MGADCGLNNYWSPFQLEDWRILTPFEICLNTIQSTTIWVLLLLLLKVWKPGLFASFPSCVLRQCQRLSLSHCLGYSHLEFEQLKPGVGRDVTKAAVLTCWVGLGWSSWHAPGDIKYKNVLPRSMVSCFKIFSKSSFDIDSFHWLLSRRSLCLAGKLPICQWLNQLLLSTFLLIPTCVFIVYFPHSFRRLLKWLY